MADGEVTVPLGQILSTGGSHNERHFLDDMIGSLPNVYYELKTQITKNENNVPFCAKHHMSITL